MSCYLYYSIFHPHGSIDSSKALPKEPLKVTLKAIRVVVFTYMTFLVDVYMHPGNHADLYL